MGSAPRLVVRPAQPPVFMARDQNPGHKPAQLAGMRGSGALPCGAPAQPHVLAARTSLDAILSGRRLT